MTVPMNNTPDDRAMALEWLKELLGADTGEFDLETCSQEDFNNFETIRKALETPAPVWMDIESAPKDGTYILAYGALAYSDDREIKIGVTRWITENVSYWEQTSKDTQKLITKDDSHWDYSAEIIFPTHWMPLPTPPELKD